MKSIQYSMRKKNGKLVVTFVGTNEWLDFWYHVQAWPNRAGLHAGWARAYLREVPLILDDFDKEFDGGPLVIRGHSYGAVIAALFALDLSDDDYDIESVELTGCPMFCQAKAADRFKYLPMVNRRYGGDIVTSFFPWFYPPKWYTLEGPPRGDWQIAERFKDHVRYTG